MKKNDFSHEKISALSEGGTLDIGQGYQLSRKGITKDGQMITLGFLTIEDVFKDCSSGKKFLDLAFNSDGELTFLRVEAADIEAKKLGSLMQYGVPVDQKKKADLSNALFLIGQRIVPKTLGNQLGFNIIQTEADFFGVNDSERLSNTIKNAFSLEVKGSFEGELEMVHILAAGLPECQIVYLAGLAAITGWLNNYYCFMELQSPIINLYGDSSTGKTTVVMQALTPFGNPSQRETKSFFKTFASTENSLVKSCSYLQGFSIGIDDAGAGKEGDKAKFLLRLSNGKDSDRLSSDSNLNTGSGFYCSVLCTGEKSIRKNLSGSAGAHLRLIELENLIYAEDKKDAEGMKKRSLQNFGHIGPEFAKKLLALGESIEEYLQKTFDESYQTLTCKVDSDDSKLNRYMNQCALILQTGSVFNELFDLAFDLNAVKLLLLETVDQVSAYLDYSQNALSQLEQWVQSHRQKFATNSIPAGGNSFIGRIDSPNQQGISRVWITKINLEKIFEELELADLKVVMTELKNKGYLNFDKGRLQKKYQQDWYYVINMYL